MVVIRFPDTAPGAPLSVSATLFVTYQSCPQQALGRLRGEYPADTIATFRGSLAHRLFARHLAHGPIADEDVGLACRQEIGAADAHLNMKLGPLALNRPSRLGPVLAEVGDLYARFKRLSTEGISSAEVSLEADVGHGVILRGRVDAVFEDLDGSTSIIDWKTGSWLEDAEPQLAFYALLWTMAHDMLPAKAEAVSVRTGERIGIEPTVESVEETALEVGEMVDVLRSGFDTGNDLERRGGPQCRWCPLLGSCSEGRAAVGVLSAH
jgi:RecB family exonuclease